MKILVILIDILLTCFIKRFQTTVIVASMSKRTRLWPSLTRTYMILMHFTLTHFYRALRAFRENRIHHNHKII